MPRLRVRGPREHARLQSVTLPTRARRVTGCPAPTSRRSWQTRCLPGPPGRGHSGSTRGASCCSWLWSLGRWWIPLRRGAHGLQRSLPALSRPFPQVCGSRTERYVRKVLPCHLSPCFGFCSATLSGCLSHLWICFSRGGTGLSLSRRSFCFFLVMDTENRNPLHVFLYHVLNFFLHSTLSACYSVPPVSPAVWHAGHPCASQGPRWGRPGCTDREERNPTGHRTEVRWVLVLRSPYRPWEASLTLLTGRGLTKHRTCTLSFLWARAMRSFWRKLTFHRALGSGTYHTGDSREQRASESHVHSTSFLQTETESTSDL